MRQFTVNNAITRVSNAVAAGVTTVTSSAVDMAGYDTCTFVVAMGAIVTGAATSIKVQQCDTSGGTYADLTGTSVTIADDDDNQLFCVEVTRPLEQFLKCLVLRATQNSTVDSIVAIQSNNKGQVTQAATTTYEQHVSPAEGTA